MWIFEAIQQLWTNMQVFAWIFAFFMGLITVIALDSMIRYLWPLQRAVVSGNAAGDTVQPQLMHIQSRSHSIRFLSGLLPAIGLLGTLTGMYLAFHQFQDAVGTRDTALSETMGHLMHNFAIALTTTLVAVLLKLVVDFFRHFLIDQPINIVYIASQYPDQTQDVESNGMDAAATDADENELPAHTNVESRPAPAPIAAEPQLVG
jgi:hypothetical protein